MKAVRILFFFGFLEKDVGSLPVLTIVFKRTYHAYREILSLGDPYQVRNNGLLVATYAETGPNKVC